MNVSWVKCCFGPIDITMVETSFIYLLLSCVFECMVLHYLYKAAPLCLLIFIFYVFTGLSLILKTTSKTDVAHCQKIFSIFCLCICHCTSNT